MMTATSASLPERNVLPRLSGSIRLPVEAESSGLDILTMEGLVLEKKVPHQLILF